MEVKAISMSDLFAQCDDIYTDVVVASSRARQIIDSRALDLEALENVEDSEEFEALEPIVTEEIEKPMVVALRELLNGELEWRNSQSEDDEK